MNKVVRNITWIMVCRVVQSVFALIITMMSARYLGPSNFGLITYASSVVNFLVPVMNLGLNNILVREIINNPEKEGVILGTSILLSLISSICCIAGATAFSQIANSNEPVTMIVCFLFSLNLLFQAMELIQYWYQAKYLSKIASIVSLCAYIFVSAYKVYLLITNKNVYWFAVSNAFDYCLIAVSLILIYYKMGGQKLRVSLNLGKELLEKSKHYILAGMMVTVFAQTDKIMIRLMIGETATGYYGAAVTCAGLTSFVFTAIIDSFRPSIFEGLQINYNTFINRLELLYSLIIYISIFQSVFMTIFSKTIIQILFGNAYLEAEGILQIVVWYTTFSYIGAVRDVWILANNKQKYLWRINTCGALANIALNAVLIPVYGVNGAAFASLFTQFFTNIVLGYIVRPIRKNNEIMFRSLNPSILIMRIKKMLYENRS